MIPKGPTGSLPDRAEVVVVGAGIAGTSTAYQLAAAGIRDVIILEQEPLAGYHASGRNAALAYRVIAEPEVMELAVRGVAFLRDPPGDFPLVMEHRWNGSVTLASGEDVSRVAATARRLQQQGVPVQVLDPETVARRVDAVSPERVDYALLCPNDGVMDIHAMLQGYVKGARRAGHLLATGRPATALAVRSGRIEGVATAAGTIKTATVVLAAGAWSNRLAQTADLPPLPLRTCRRHLLCLDIGRKIPPNWPFVWDVTRGLYFRPESGRLLFSPCDQEEMEPHDTGVDWATVEQAAEKAVANLKGLAEARVTRAWSGLRTLTPDGRFVVGEDPRLAGLYWATGLCGHGMTTSAAVGRMTADLIAHGRTDVGDPAPHNPGRFFK